MKAYFQAFAMCQSMFCALPFPGNIWDEDSRDKMLLFLPVVGLEIGALWAAAAYLAAWLHFPNMVTAVILCAFPFVITGFIHLDGFMDVTDAVKSCRDLEKRRLILKDPHVGPFAVIGCVLLMLAQFALFAAIDSGWGILVFLPAVSRCCSAFAIAVLKPMSTSQYAGQGRSVSQKYLFVVMLALILAAGFFCFGVSAVSLLACVIGCALSIRKGYRSLGGMNGDISGYAITIGELWGIAALAIIGGVL